MIDAAFPFVAKDKTGMIINSGMTLRDYFAAKAMQTILASQYEDGLYVGDLDNDSEHLCANSAYIMADAMLEARQE
jgi:hypothetical protein